jgi:predicted negative regulator of RcsB-dependent stress response
MNQRVNRKEMKRDDFAAAVGRSVEYAESHVRLIIYAVGAVLLLVALGIALRSYLGHRQEQASQDLASAMKVYQAQVAATGANPADANAPTFPTEAARRAEAKKRFEKVRDGYGSTDAADVAGLYLAQIAADEGKLDEARKLWTDFVDDQGDSLLAGEARLNLIHLDRQQGKGEQVVQELRAMLEKSDAPLPQDVILHELGLTLEQLKRGQEAVAVYQRIVDEFPQSPYRGDAQQKLSALDPSRSPAGGAPLGGLPGFPG